VVVGLTLRVAGLAVMPDCTTPSLQVMDHGGVPVRAALTVAEPCGQIVASPLTVAVGGVFTVTVALPVAAPPVHEVESDTAVTV
jgi:hypothetical protein